MAQMFGGVYAAIGLIIGAAFSAVAMLAGLAGAAARPGADLPTWILPIFGAGAIVAFPIFYGIMGFISGLIGAALYNLFAGWIGGLTIEVDSPVSTTIVTTV
jgi:hypothetical protein